MVEKSLREVNLSSLTHKKFFPSPAAWEDQVLEIQPNMGRWTVQLTVPPSGVVIYE